jgi:hypothetical protein
MSEFKVKIEDLFNNTRTNRAFLDAILLDDLNKMIIRPMNGFGRGLALAYHSPTQIGQIAQFRRKCLFLGQFWD